MSKKVFIWLLLSLPVFFYGLVVFPYAFIVWAVGRVMSKEQVVQLGVNLMYSLDQLGNACLGGDPDETISSRAGRAVKEGRCRGCKWLCYWLNYIDPDHCFKYIETRTDREIHKL